MNDTGVVMNRYLPGNRVTLLRDGAQFFPALVRAIDGAEREIWLETYIFAADATGRLVASSLSRAAARGVAAFPLGPPRGLRPRPPAAAARPAQLHPAALARANPRAGDGRPQQRVAVAASFGTEWAKVPFIIPAASLRPGLNNVCFRFAQRRPGDEEGGYAAAVSLVQLP
jgi:hypothetical protein